MNARARLRKMIDEPRGGLMLWTPAEVQAALDAYREEVLNEAAMWFERACPEVDALLPVCMCHAAPELRALASVNQDGAT